MEMRKVSENIIFSLFIIFSISFFQGCGNEGVGSDSSGSLETKGSSKENVNNRQIAAFDVHVDIDTGEMAFIPISTIEDQEMISGSYRTEITGNYTVQGIASWDSVTKNLGGNVSFTNDHPTQTLYNLEARVTAISNPAVTVSNADGTCSGYPCWDYGTLIYYDGSVSKLWEFHDAAVSSFDFQVLFYADLTPVLPNNRAYVTNIFSNDVSVVDLTINSEIARVPIGNLPIGVAVTPDHRWAYATSHISNDIRIIDLSSDTVVKTILTGNKPYWIVINSAGTFAYVSIAGEDKVIVLDLSTNSMAASIQVGISPVGIALSPDGNYAYVACKLSDDVYVIDLNTNSVVTSLSSASRPVWVDITPDGQTIYVANSGTHDVGVFDAATYSYVTTIGVGINPTGVTVSPDGAYVYAVNHSSYDVSVIDVSLNVVTTTIPVGIRPLVLEFTPDGSTGYVTNVTDDNLSIIDIGTNLVTGAIPVGDGPRATALLIY